MNHRLEDVPAGMEIVGPASTLTEEQTVDFHAFKQAEKTYQLHREMVRTRRVFLYLLGSYF